MSALIVLGQQYAGNESMTSDADSATTTSGGSSIASLLQLAISVGAAYIAWNRSAGTSIFWRVFMTIIGFMFGLIYLIYVMVLG